MSGVAACEQVTAASAPRQNAEGGRTTPLSVRERFLATLYNSPLLRADAIVVYSGDGKVRLNAAVGALVQKCAQYVVVSGGVDDPPRSLHADEAARYLVSAGLAPDRIIKDAASQNTREQSEWLASEIVARGWGAVILVASAYHMPRAFLTLLQSMTDRGALCQVVPLVAYAPWWEEPEGTEITRADLLADELRKCDEYRALYGHVASFEEGLAYLERCEDGLTPPELPEAA